MQNKSLPSVMAVRQFCYGRGFKRIAICAIAAAFALLCFGGGDGLIPLAQAVTCRGYGLLHRQNLSANSTVLAFGQARLCAGGCDCCVDRLGVTCCGHGLLRNQNLTANSTVLAFGQARLCAGGGDGCVDCLGVRDHSHIALLDLTAYARALLLAGGTAGGRNGFDPFAKAMYVRLGVLLCCSRGCIRLRLGVLLC